MVVVAEVTTTVRSSNKPISPLGDMPHRELGYPPQRGMGLSPQREVGVYPQREVGYLPQKRNNNTNINMHMKQVLQKGVATRLLGVLVAFFMMGSLTVKAQTSSFGGGSQFSGANSANALIQVIKPKPVASSYPISSKTKDRPFTKADGGDLIQIGEAKYQSWNDAVEALKENDVITLLQNIELEWGDDTEPGFKIPKVACTIKGISTTTIFKSVSSIEMEAPITFKDVTLDLNELLACGNKLVFDENVTCTNQSMTVCGGSGFYEEGVEIKSTSITIKSGTFNKVYGGGFYVDVTGDTYIDVQGGTIGWLYGGGLSAPVKGTANVEIESGNIGYLYGGGENASAVCGNTNIIINNGVFGQINEYRYNLMGGGDAAPVTGKAKVTINGGTFNCFVTAGGGQNSNTNATCGSTELNITNGTFTKWTYGGGWASPVLGTATVTVSGSPALITLCGGGARPTASCQSTDVNISGTVQYTVWGGGEDGSVTGECKVHLSGSASVGWVYGGGRTGSYGSTIIIMEEGTVDNDIVGGSFSGTCGGTDVAISGGSVYNIYGGGEGDRVDNPQGAVVSCTGGEVTGLCKLSVTGTTHVGGSINGGGKNGSAHVGATDVFVDLSSGTFGNVLSGAGRSGHVNGDVKLTVTGGDFAGIFGGGSSLFPIFEGDVKGNVEISVRDITVGNLDIVNSAGQLKGSGKITIEGGNVRFNNSMNIGGDKANILNCTLVFKDCGNVSSPYEIPTIRSFSFMKLDNSYITPSKSSQNRSFSLAQLSCPLIIEGGKGLIGDFLISLDQPRLNDELIRTDGLPAGSSFSYDGPLYKAGNGYRLGRIPASPPVSIHKINVTHTTNGELTVIWNDGKRDIRLEDDDQVPENSSLGLSIVPASGYRLKAGSLKAYKTGDESVLVSLSGNTFTMPDHDVAITAIFEEIPYTPEPTVFYTVSIPTVEGIVTDPVAGDYDVESWSSFRFYLTLDKDYDQSEPVVTTDRGETIQPRSSDGAYIVKYVRSDVKITIDGIVKNPDPVANAEIQSGTKAWVNNHQLFIRTDKQEKVFIYAFDGKLRKTFLSAGGEEHVALSSGSYIVRIGQNNFKVIL